MILGKHWLSEDHFLYLRLMVRLPFRSVSIRHTFLPDIYAMSANEFELLSNRLYHLLLVGKSVAVYPAGSVSITGMKVSGFGELLQAGITMVSRFRILSWKSTGNDIIGFKDQETFQEILIPDDGKHIEI